VPVWRATRAVIRAGYPVKRANLSYFADDEAALFARCQRLTAEQNEWLSPQRPDPLFDGTIRSVINLWQADPASPYHTLEASSRHPYNVYARMIVSTVGTRRVDALDGRDMRRWHAKWMEPDEAGGKPRLARARTAITILKTALTFAAGCRKSGCKELRDILRDIDFPGPRSRREAPTAPEIVAARKAVHELGHPAAALAYALQFEGTMRQWDVIGKWVPLADKRPSPMIEGGKKWVGPMWSQIDEHLILRYAPSKTQLTSGAEVVLDLKALPMVMEELAEVPEGGRRGPLIVNPRTGLPYRHEYFRVLWRKAAAKVGISATVWNRDTRAAGVTEARQAASPNEPSNILDDVAKQAGHTTKRTTARVYDRDRLEAARRVAAARIAYRRKKRRVNKVCRNASHGAENSTA
jgi:integrase